MPESLLNGRQTFSIFTWIKYTENKGGIIFSGSLAGGNEFIIYAGGYYLNGPVYTTPTAKYFTLNKWMHFGVTNSPNTIKFYLDGKMIYFNN